MAPNSSVLLLPFCRAFHRRPGLLRFPTLHRGPNAEAYGTGPAEGTEVRTVDLDLRVCISGSSVRDRTC